LRPSARKKHLIIAETYDERHRAFSIHVNTTRGLFVRASFRTFASNFVFNLDVLFVKTMLGHQFAYSVAPFRKVKEVKFGILSPEDIVRATFFMYSVTHSFILTSQKAISAAKIEHPEVMDEATHKPKMDGLMGPCMDTIADTDKEEVGNIDGALNNDLETTTNHVAKRDDNNTPPHLHIIQRPK
jgi:hypothetical protein